MPLVNLDELRAAQDLPQLLLRGKTYTGKLLSFEEWLAYTASLQSWTSGKATPAEVMFIARRLVDALFPRPWWAFWRPRVSTLLLREAPGVWQKAVVGFINSQVDRMAPGGEPTSSSPPDSFLPVS